MVLRRAAIAATVLLAAAGPARAQEDYVILKAFSLSPPFDVPVAPSPLQKGRDGKFYASSGNEVFTITEDGTYTPTGKPLASAIAIDGGDGFFYAYGRVAELPSIVKFSEGSESAPTVLYAFADASQGSLAGPLVQGTDGEIYGIVHGANGSETIFFRLTRDGVFTPLHTFTPVEGGGRFTQLIRASDGFFYGTTYSGGGGGHGLVFQIAMDGTLTPLHAFAGGSEGSSPRNALLEGSDGWFYGTTLGDAGNGIPATIYRVRPDGTFATLASLAPLEITEVIGALVEGSDGHLYGTSDFTIFRVTSRDVRLLHSAAFASPGNAGTNRYGGFLSGVLEGSDGNFYGTARSGGPGGNGAVFRLNRARAACTNVTAPSWGDDGTLSALLGAIKTETPAFAAAWLVLQNGATPLWTTLTPAIDPTFSYALTLAVSPPDALGVFSLVITSTLQVCSAWSPRGPA